MRGRKRTADPREKILASAKREFSEHGFTGGRMSRIARRAGVNKALIHYYFTDKKSLYLEVLARIYRGKVAHPEGPDYFGPWRLTPSQKLHVIVYFIVTMFLKATDEEAMRIIFWELAEGGSNLESLMVSYIIPRQNILQTVIAEGIDKGEFRPVKPSLAVMNIFSFISFYVINREIYRGGAVFQTLYGGAGESEVLDFILDLVFRSLSPPGRVLTAPPLPNDLRATIDNILALLIEHKNEVMNDELLRRLEQIMGTTTGE